VIRLPFRGARSCNLALAIAFSFFLVSCAGMEVGRGPQAQFEAGMGLFSQGKYAEAAERFEKAAALDQDFATPYVYLGKCYLYMGEYRRAVVPLRTAYRLSPEDVKRQALDLLLDALFGAAGSERDKGRLKISVDDLKEAYSLAPDSKRARDELIRSLLSLATVFLAEGDVDGAVRSFSEVLQVSPENVAAYLGLARSFLKKGDTKDTLDAAIRAFKLDPRNADALRLFLDLKTE
jgi:tetratricopeptide (TPR) repeat protein